MTLAIILALAAWVTVQAHVVLVAARMMQIEEYEPKRLLHWARQRPWVMHRSVLVAFATAVIAAAIGVAVSGDAGRVIACLGLVVGSLGAHIFWRWADVKKPLVYTPRMWRLLATVGGMTLVVAIICGVAVAVAPLPIACLLLAAMAVSMTWTPVLELAGASVLLSPLEAAIRRSFLRRARVRLHEISPLVIAVAGSYGKTSTKHILAQLLQPQVNTLATPKSFNTLMGVVRTINEHLEKQHRAFIVEMDAYAPGEIASISQLCQPKAAVITSVGPQHLERFGTVEAISDAMYELVNSIALTDPVVMYCGDAQSSHLAERAASAGHHVIRYGLGTDAAVQLDVLADRVESTEKGWRFTWSWRARQLEYAVEIPLLGIHSVLNTTAALAIVCALNCDVSTAVGQTSRLQPTQHRLQPLPSSNGIQVIDDSFNANPVGVHNGLDALAMHPGRAKILVTPGLVELGSREDEENHRYGEHAGRVCDHVIIVRARTTTALHSGLQASGMAADHVHIVGSLREATDVIGRVASSGDVVLFANDLPDTYL